MTFIFVFVVAIFNCIALYFASFIAVYGDGRSHGVDSMRLFGFSWIALCTVLAIFWCKRGKRAPAVAAALLTLPAGVFAALFISLMARYFEGLKPNSSEFEAACRDAGPRYVQLPASKVESVAFDWARGTYPPRTNHFEIDQRNNVTGLRGGLPRFAPAFKFIEGRCCQYEGPPSDGIGPYLRHTAKGPYIGITELTADALVTYKVSSPPGEGLQIVELVVTDRRDQRLLATLRYVLSKHGRRGCGAVQGNVMDEQMFVRRAVGAN